MCVPRYMMRRTIRHGTWRLHVDRTSTLSSAFSYEQMADPVLRSGFASRRSRSQPRIYCLPQGSATESLPAAAPVSKLWASLGFLCRLGTPVVGHQAPLRLGALHLCPWRPVAAVEGPSPSGRGVPVGLVAVGLPGTRRFRLGNLECACRNRRPVQLLDGTLRLIC